MLETVWLVAVVGAALALIWFCTRAWRINNRFLKWTAAGTSALAGAIALAIGVLTIIGMIKQHQRAAPVPVVQIAASDMQIRRGRAIAASFCDGCHSRFGTLTGGSDVGKELPVPVGSFVSSNLTRAGALRGWTDGEIFRAIRNGVDAHGRWLTIMSYTNAGKLSDADILAVIAYLRSVPAEGQETPDPPDHLNLLGLVMLGAGLLPTGAPVFTGNVGAPHPGPTAQYGEYILSYQDCRLCHGANLTGGVPGQLGPVGPNLALVRKWQAAEFIAAMRTGVDPYGHQISQLMPWRPLGRMDDDELTAIYEYLTRPGGPQFSATK